MKKTITTFLMLSFSILSASEFIIKKSNLSVNNTIKKIEKMANSNSKPHIQMEAFLNSLILEGIAMEKKTNIKNFKEYPLTLVIAIKGHLANVGVEIIDKENINNDILQAALLTIIYYHHITNSEQDFNDFVVTLKEKALKFTEVKNNDIKFLLKALYALEKDTIDIFLEEKVRNLDTDLIANLIKEYFYIIYIVSNFKE